MSMSEFYNKCAELLGTEYNCESFKYPYRTRWNNRTPGSGRYPGFGIIRKFGNKIHVALQRPVSHHGIYDTEKEVLQLLQDLNIKK